MRGIFVIAGREIGTYLKSPAFYVICFVHALFLGSTYYSMLSRFAMSSTRMMRHAPGAGGGYFHQEVIVAHVSNINLVLLFAIPFLAVRLFSEEKKLRTFDLLLTSPITATQIVIGKYLASAAVVLFFILISMVYPMTTEYFTEIQWGPLFSAYAGIFFLGLIYAAIGNFASSISENVFLAGFLGIVLNIGLWFVAWGTILFEEPTVNAIFKHISVASHFSENAQGSIDSVGIVFFMSLIALYCFLTQRVVESARWR